MFSGLYNWMADGDIRWDRISGLGERGRESQPVWDILSMR